MNKHIKYLELAKSVSLLSDYKQHKIGAILVYKRHVISVGYNMEKTHPIQAEFNKYRDLSGSNIIPKAHAETICIARAKALNVPYTDCTLYVFRQWKNGAWALAMPCGACMELIKSKGIQNIVYTTYGGYAVEYLNFPLKIGY